MVVSRQLTSLNLLQAIKAWFDVVVQSAIAIWTLWRFRNEIVFRSKRPRQDAIIGDEVKLWSFI